MKKVFVAFVLFLGFGVASFAQVNATAISSATIVTPIAITKTVDLNFGNVAVSGTTGGTVVLAPAGTRTVTGGVTLPVTAGTVSAASFNVTGFSNSAFSITLPTSITLTRTGGGTMIVDNFTSSPTDASNPVLTGGAATVTVGATLNVSNGQTAGLYENNADMTVTVNYE